MNLIFKSLTVYHEEDYKKPILFFLIAFTLSQTVPAQNSDIKKDKSFGSSRNGNAAIVLKRTVII